jgi:hypothetical protein
MAVGQGGVKTAYNQKLILPGKASLRPLHLSKSQSVHGENSPAAQG